MQTLQKMNVTIATGATRKGKSAVPPHPCFNPRPGLATGATQVRILPGLLVCVSIRAPVSRPGRPRGTMLVQATGGVSIRAPVSRPGRQYHRHHEQRKHTVSIRAPVSRPGRLRLRRRLRRMMKFQSAPRSRDRGDSPPASPLRPAYRFNPRPGLATGATEQQQSCPRRQQCFNPRPGLATGATG